MKTQTATQPKTPAARLASDLAEVYTGTEHIYHLPNLRPALTYTDGIRALANEAGCYWLLETIVMQAIEQPKFASGLWVVRMTSRPDSSGLVEIGFDIRASGKMINENGEPGADYSEEIPFTDFPEGVFEFYIENGTMLLKSEY
jgi:hypothetical protein